MKLSQLVEGKKLYSFWDLVDHYGVEDEVSRSRDESIAWINHNNAKSIGRMIKNEDYVLVSKLELFFKHVKKYNYGKPVTTPEEFEKCLDSTIKIWRGGGGTFDPDFKLGRSWVSFTADRSRANTFSIYDGTMASRSFVLSKRKEYWIVEAEVKLDDVLLYLSQGMDDEVIVNKKILRNVKIIETSMKKAA